MASRNTHLVAAVTAGIGIYAIYKTLMKENWTFKGICLATSLSGFAGLLPDMLEPATSPNHRALFHNLMLFSLLLFRNKAYDKMNLDDKARRNCNIFLAGYSSHLALDFTTPKGLPLL